MSRIARLIKFHFHAQRMFERGAWLPDTSVLRLPSERVGKFKMQVTFRFFERKLRVSKRVDCHAAGKMSDIDCGPGGLDDCYDKTAATQLKGAAIGVILVAGALGVLIPLVGRRSRFLRTDGDPFFIAKAFAAGVILATAFVHMLPTAHDTLANPCLPEDPWGKFAWAGFIAMLAALATLAMDFAATEFYMNKHGHAHHHNGVEKPTDNKNGKPQHMILKIDPLVF